MSEATDDKKKRPHSPEEVLALEDSVAEIQAKIKELRLKMQTAKMPSVNLMSGTFKLRLRELAQIANKFLVECDNQALDHSVAAAKEVIANRSKGSDRKRS